MRRLLLLAALALVAAAPARAGAPLVNARAYVLEDARTGETLASSHAHDRLPIASITKLMTVLVTLQHHKLTDVVTVDPRAAAVGESSIELGPGDQLTVRDLIKGALIQSANDAADALALSVAPDYPSFARLMNAQAAVLGLHDTHFVRPDGLDSPGEYSSAADVTKLARVLMRTRFVRETVGEETDTIAGGRTLHTWDDLLSLYTPTFRRQDRAHERSGLVPGRGGARPRRHGVRDAARVARRAASGTSISSRSSSGGSGSSASSPPSSRAHLRGGAASRTVAHRSRSSRRSRCWPSRASTVH